ncbi:hypothetical protein AB0I35_12780 [Nocardia sp. NPDC050378]|uniref:hypothetical protein n=1 Tax=Nocardia sp. NPDC050378 TaxID=3155400 RepID=UPI0033F7D92A
MTSDSDYGQMIRSTFPTLDLWRTAVGTAFEPLPGSQLRSDDLDWPPAPLSAVAHQGLSVATTHLQAIRAHLEPGSGPGQLFPTAHDTLCRTALVGAAQAVWLLVSEDSRVRLRRHRMLITDMQGWHSQYLRDLQNYAGDEDREAIETVAAHLDTRIQEMSAKRAAAGEKAVFNNTEMIRQAAQEVFVGRPDAARLVQAAVLVWRSGSGAAHGFYWQTYGRPGMLQRTSPDVNGIAQFVVGGSVHALVEPYMAAYQISALGWKLLRQRGR